MSTLSGYGHIKAKRLEVADRILSHGNTDDTNTLTVIFSDQSASRNLTVPALGGNRNIICSGEGQLVNADINASASVAYSKLNLTNSIVNGDITNATILPAKLDLSQAYNFTGDLKKGGVNVATMGDVGGAITASNGLERVSDDIRIADNGVSSAKIASGAVGAAELGVSAGAVSASKALVVDASKNIDGLNDVKMDGALYIDSSGADKWRIKKSGDNMVFEYHNGTSWAVKHTFTSS